MAHNIDLISDNGMILDLVDGTTYNIAHGSGMGVPSIETIFATPWQRGFSPLVDYNVGNRVVTIPMHIKGTSLDTWITNYQQLAQILRDAKDYSASGGRLGARAYLCVQMSGMTNTTVFDVIAGEIPDPAIFRPEMVVDTSRPSTPFVPITFTLKPWGRPEPLSSSTSGTLNNGGGTGNTASTYTLTDTTGERPAPCRITITPSADLRRLIIGKRSRGNVSNFIFVLHCETGAYTGYTTADVEANPNFTVANVVNAAAQGGNVLRLSYTTGGNVTRAKVITWTINDNLPDFYGRFMVFVRSDAAGHANLTGVGLSYGGSDGSLYQLPSTTLGAAWADRMLPLGVVTIPERPLPYDAVKTSFVMQLDVTIVTGVTFDADFDCLYLVPCDEGYLDIEFSANSTAADKLIIDGLADQPVVYLLNSTGVIPSSNTRPSAVRGFQPFTIMPGDNLFAALIVDTATAGSRTGEHPLGDTYTLKVERYPLFDQVR